MSIELRKGLFHSSSKYSETLEGSADSVIQNLYAFCVSAKMAMEYRQIIQDAHPKPILCLQYNPFRREIYTSGEDSTIRVWESESGKLLNTWIEHIGWVTQLLYW
jgi:WD40 repeat protein